MMDFFVSEATLSGGGCTQYMTGLWWHNESQKKIALAKLDEVRNKGQVVDIHTGPVTDVYRAEEYHQRFYAKKGY
eukprot:m.160309 g.160309  ORF g.160309 m.160309 type:complete len:75 (-) comp11927_c0_seq1:296-520(-)